MQITEPAIRCISNTKSEISIFDAGTGSGVLTAAVVDRLQNEPIVKHIHIKIEEMTAKVKNGKLYVTAVFFPLKTFLRNYNKKLFHRK